MKNKKIISLAMAASSVATMAVPAFAAPRTIEAPSVKEVNMNLINGRAQKLVTTLEFKEKFRALEADGKNPEVVGQIKDTNGKTTHYYISYDQNYDVKDVAYAKKAKLEIEEYLNKIKDMKVEHTNELKYTISVRTTGYEYGVDSRAEITVQNNLDENDFETTTFVFTNVDPEFKIIDDVIIQRDEVKFVAGKSNAKEYKKLSKAIYEIKKAVNSKNLYVTTIRENSSNDLLIKIFKSDKKTQVGEFAVREYYTNFVESKLPVIPYTNDFIGHFAEDAIVESMLDNVISMTNKYEPNKGMTRAHFAQLICNAFPEIRAEVDALDKNPNFNPEFKDIAKGDWYAKYVVTLNNLGLINGYPDGTFRPDETITRQEAAVVLAAIEYGVMDKSLDGKYKLVDIKTIDKNGKTVHKDIVTKFDDDASIPAWCDEAVAYLATNEEGAGRNILNGYPDGTFRPANKITRGEAVLMVNRARN